MRNSKAQKIRQEIYGKEAAPRFRLYRTVSGQRLADELRQKYQSAKKAMHKEGPSTVMEPSNKRHKGESLGAFKARRKKCNAARRKREKEGKVWQKKMSIEMI